MQEITRPTPVYAAEVSSLESQIVRIAENNKIATTSLYNLAMSESSLGEARVGDSGKSCGVIHFHRDYYPEENSRCEDDEYILNRAAQMIANGEGWKFTPGNCYQFVKALIGKLPRMSEIIPNSDYPRVGGLAIFHYKEKHIAVVDEVLEDGFWIREANYEPYKIGKRFIKWNDKNLIGFASYKD